MDNGWEMLTPDEEARLQKRAQIIFRIIITIFFAAGIFLVGLSFFVLVCR